MTYETREISLQSGEPIELYEFKYGAVTLRFTSAKSDYFYLGHTWTAALIKRGNIEVTSEKARNNIKLNVVRDFPIAELFRIAPPSIITLTVHRVHFGDSDGGVIWGGRVLDCDLSASPPILNCEPASTSLERIGLRRMYQRGCPHVLYGNQCKVDQAAFTVPVTLTAINGLLLTSPTFGLYADRFFAGGYIEFDNAGQIELRFITEHTGTTIKVNTPLYSLVVGSALNVYAGCDHTLSTCHSTFNNTDNFGGMPYIPTKNPFDGAIY